MKKVFLLVCIINSMLLCQAQQHTITVHFLYGSVPAKGFEKTEKKKLGGKKGGHVTIETGDSIIGFQPKGTCHIFGEKKNANGYFKAESKKLWQNDTIASKYASVIIPVNDEQYSCVKNTFDNYLEKAPYDYAVFGMRCAAASYDVLEKAGLVKKRSRFSKWATYFYPQLLRRRLLKLAKENNYAVVKHSGRNSRVWEKE